MDPTSSAAVEVVNAVLNQDIRAVVEDPLGAAHGAGLQQLLFWTSPSQCNDDALVTALSAAFSPTWTVPVPTPSIADGAVECAAYLLDANTPTTTSDVLCLVFGMCLATLLYQIGLCFLQAPTAVASGLIKLPAKFDAMMISLMGAMINDDVTYEGNLSDYLARVSTSIGSAMDTLTPRVLANVVFTPGVRAATMSMMKPYFVCKYLCMFDPTKSARADTNYFDARYSTAAVFAVYSDALLQLSSMVPSTSTRGLTDAVIQRLTLKYKSLQANIPTVTSENIVSMYELVSNISTATRTVASRLEGADRDIALRSGVNGAQVANVAHSKTRLQAERVQMWLWIVTCVLSTAVAAGLIASGHTPQFWLHFIVVFVVVALLALIGFFRSPHPSNDSSY